MGKSGKSEKLGKSGKSEKSESWEVVQFKLYSIPKIRKPEVGSLQESQYAVLNTEGPVIKIIFIPCNQRPVVFILPLKTMNLEHTFTIDSLLEGCKRGERKAQEMLYRKLASPMMGVCMRYAKDKQEAEDILQMGFVKVFNKVADFRSDGSFEGWIRRIMVNMAIETYRKNLRTLINVVDIDEVYDQPQTTFDMSGLETKDLLNLVQELSNGYRLVFNMYVIEGYSHKEIGAALGMTEGASKSQLSRARAILRDKIIKMEGSNYESHVG